MIFFAPKFRLLFNIKIEMREEKTEITSLIGDLNFK